MTTTAIISGGKLTGPSTTAIISGGSVTGPSTTTAIISAGSVTSTGSSTKAIISGGFIGGAFDPFATIKLPAGTWTQTAGPTVTPPTLLAPGALAPGTSMIYTQPNGTTFTISVLPHTIFYTSAGVFHPVRIRHN
jgi:hypothetical protein